MLAVFKQPEMDHSKTRDESALLSTNNFFHVTCVQVWMYSGHHIWYWKDRQTATCIFFSSWYCRDNLFL